MSNFDYYNFRIKNVIDKINKEIKFYENCEYAKIYPLNEYIEYLKSRLGMDKKNEVNAMTQYDNMGNKREIKKMNLDEYTKDMDILVFSRPWNKLKIFHKMMKIKEYVNSLEYQKKVDEKKIIKNREYILKEISNGLNNKKFGKNKAEVIYDPESRMILSISCLSYNKKTKLYEVDWDL